ncbi:hypothetical protein LTR66_016846, partial [Elasticomyces elasticus]
MAKSARASSRKKNNAALRTKIFGPAIDARTERLSAKLQELIAKPQVELEKKMELDQETPAEQLQHELEDKAEEEEEEDVEMKGVTTRGVKSSKRNKVSSGR